VLIVIRNLRLRAQKTAPTRTDTSARVINHSPRFVHYFVANRHATKRKAQINPSLNYQRHWTKMVDKDAAGEGEHFRARGTLAKIDCPKLKLDVFAWFFSRGTSFQQIQIVIGFFFPHSCAEN